MPERLHDALPRLRARAGQRPLSRSHIYRDGPADKEWLDLKVGDYVLAIDGKQIKAGDNYWELLNSPLNEYVTVTRGRLAGRRGRARTVRIKTVTSLTDIKYEEWVAKNREFVDKETNGQIAYVHIRSMNQPSLAEVSRTRSTSSRTRRASSSTSASTAAATSTRS